jgi:lipoate-protein ligase A
MNIIEFSTPDPATQLACDEGLLQLAEEGSVGECLRIYEMRRPTVVLGLPDQHRRAAVDETCERRGVGILRRRSGGGAVVLGPGCLVYSVILRRDRPGMGSVRGSYRWILGRLCEELSEEGLRVEPAGTSDLAWNGRKVGGSAQQRKHNYLLHHGTLLYGMRRELIEQFLGEVREPPPYRNGRSHRDFVTNLPLNRCALVRAVKRAFGATGPPQSPPPDLTGRAEQLVTERYGCPEWTRRR